MPEDLFQLEYSPIAAGSAAATVADKLKLGQAPTNKRGRFTVIDRANRKVNERYLMFNPSTVDDTKATNWGTTDVPGASHPVYSFGSGGERLISFELYIDGDRGRFGREQGRNTGSLSIKDELYWYRAMVHPVGYGAAASDVAPYLILFTHGELYNNLRCIVKQANWKVNYWVPGPTGPTPVRATVSMVLGEAPEQSVTREEVLRLGQIGGG